MEVGTGEGWEEATVGTAAGGTAAGEAASDRGKTEERMVTGGGVEEGPRGEEMGRAMEVEERGEAAVLALREATEE